MPPGRRPLGSPLGSPHAAAGAPQAPLDLAAAAATACALGESRLALSLVGSLAAIGGGHGGGTCEAIREASRFMSMQALEVRWQEVAMHAFEACAHLFDESP
jgi:hypothetical protein